MIKFNVALDGPAGAGKSTVARLLAASLGFIYVDTGAMYRAVTWKVLRAGFDPSEMSGVVSVVRDMRIELKPGHAGQQVFVDGKDVTQLIRTDEINRNVSQIAMIPEIRQYLVDYQKQLAADKGVVMDGRDIGTHVLPNAEVKVFLSASARERAERRYKEMVEPVQTLDELEQEIQARDTLDTQREASPLVQAPDAVYIDSTDMSLDQVVEYILQICRSKVSGGI